MQEGFCAYTISTKISGAGFYRVKSGGKFGYIFANSRNPDETAPYEPSHQEYDCSLIYLFFIPIFKI